MAVEGAAEGSATDKGGAEARGFGIEWPMAAVARAMNVARPTATIQRMWGAPVRAGGGVRLMPASQGTDVLQARMGISIRRR